MTEATEGQYAGLTPWQLKTLTLSVILAAGGYLAFSVWSGWEEVVEAFFMIGVVGSLIALFLSLINYALRFVRWQIYLERLGYSIPIIPSARIYLAGFALTTTPGKAGEAFRGVFLKQRGVPFSATLAAFISERLSDLIAILILTLFGLSTYPEMHGIAIAGLVGVLAVLALIASSKTLKAIHQWANQKEGKFFTGVEHAMTMLQDARRCHSPFLIFAASGLSVISWGAEALAFYLMLDWLGADASFSFAVFVYAISMLAGAISFLPGGLGSAEAVMVSLLALNGMDMPEAVAATVFIRLTTLWFAVVLGFIALFKSRRGEVAS